MNTKKEYYNEVRRIKIEYHDKPNHAVEALIGLSYEALRSAGMSKDERLLTAQSISRVASQIVLEPMRLRKRSQPTRPNSGTSF